MLEPQVRRSVQHLLPSRVLMRKLNFLVILYLFVSGVCWAEAPPFETGFKFLEPPVGLLGYRIGSYLTIEGVRAEEGKVGSRTLLVDKINAFKLEKPLAIWIENLDLPAAKRCVIKGYETGQWIGTPQEVCLAAGKCPQAAWQFKFYFIATSVAQPVDLQLKE